MIKFADFLKIKKSYIFATYITKKGYNCYLADWGFERTESKKWLTI